MFSLFSKKLSEVSELKSVLPADLSGAVASAEKAATSWFSKMFPFLAKKVASLPELSVPVTDLSGSVASAKSWFSKLFSASEVPAPAPASVLKIAKNDLVVVTVSLPSVWSCSQYDLKVAVSLPELVKPAKADAEVSVPVPVSVPVIPEPVNDSQIYDSIEKVPPPTPPSSTHTSPESEKNEVVEQIQDTPPE
jgi:hypothetical protein